MEKEKGKCKQCGTPINPKYAYCSLCNEKYNNEIIISNKQQKDDKEVINFYKILIFDRFDNHNTIVLTFLGKYAHITNRIIQEIRHMGIKQNLRYIEKVRIEKDNKDLEYIKAPLELLPAVKAWKLDIKKKILREDD